MKKILLLLFSVMFVSIAAVKAQNLQVLYDLGKDRKYFTTTFEMFKPDKFGSTFLFFDVDYNRGGNMSASLSYFEIARYVTLPLLNKKLDVTVQYNDGHTNGYALGPVWLGGFSYPVNLKFITIKTDLLYRSFYQSEGADWQLTFAWNKFMLEGRLQFCGFLDIWSQGQKGEKFTVFLSEPQLWFRVWENLNLGGELEISRKFVSDDWQFNPALGFKWQFD